jgi:hypothetical protein
VLCEKSMDPCAIFNKENVRKNDSAGSGAFGSDFLIVFDHDLYGKGRPEDSEPSGAIAILLFSIRICKKTRGGGDPEPSGVISLLL